jgi:PAS domain S-box-containing protein
MASIERGTSRDVADATDSVLEAGELEALRGIVEGTARSTGDEFFRNLVHHLASALGTSQAFIAEFLPPNVARTVAYWSHGNIAENLEFELAGTPCEEVVTGKLCFHPSGVEALFPRELGIDSYIGAPLVAQDGTVLGHVCAFDERPMAENRRRQLIFQVFAARAAAELDRLRAEQRLRESEDRLQDLFEEAPIAYIHEGLDSKLIRANRAARRILGIGPEEVQGMLGKTLVADTPDNQRRLNEAFAAVGRGTDTSGVVLEMRRKSDGEPVWIEWWSKPDPSGAYTRTMFLDITERIRMEREQARLQAQNSYLQEEIKSVHNFEEIIGHSRGLTTVLDDVRRVAPTDASVLIMGESGTGKELIARAIHSASKRADRPFIKINCAALPAGLVESELFGHERGAFSGALQRRIGRFELAHSGTIFLDEIGEVPHDVQVKLLRVLQEREFERVGGNQTIKTDVRVVAATNRDLQKAIRDSAFRSDLYYRLNVFPVHVPPLRERVDDIPLLAEFFMRKYAPRVGRQVTSIEPESIKRLARYAWPGNIRELENLVERAIILATSPVLRIGNDLIPEAATEREPARDATRGKTEPPDSESSGGESVNGLGRDQLDAIQREHIFATLTRTNWVIEGERGAANRLGMKPATLRHRMKKLGISRASPRDT